MTNRSFEPSAAPASTPARVMGRRRLVAASAGAVMGSATLIGTLRAQADSSAGHSPLSQASPGPEPVAPGPEGLAALLPYVPQAMLDRPKGSGVHWYYADLAQQFDAVGVPRTAAGRDEENANWLPALMTLATASSAFQHARLPEFTDAIGFDPLGVGQTLLVGDPPIQLTLFRGGLDLTRLDATWEASGYTPMSTSDGTSFWTIGTRGEFEIDHPIQRVVFASFNNLTLVGDTLLCAATQEVLEAALAAGAGRMPAAIGDPVFGASLRTLPRTTVSAMALSPSAIGVSNDANPDQSAPPDDLITESDAEVGPMPPYDGLVTAVGAGAVTTEGEVSDGVAMIRIVTGSADAAEQVTSVVEYRWNEGISRLTGQPYTELMEITDLSVEDNVAMIDFEQVRSSRVWSDLFLSRDTLPFVP